MMKTTTTTTTVATMNARLTQYPFRTTMTAAKSRFARQRYPISLAVILIVSITVAIMAAPAMGIKRPGGGGRKRPPIDPKHKSDENLSKLSKISDMIDKFGSKADSINEIAETAQLVGPLLVKSTPGSPNTVAKRQVALCPESYIIDLFGHCVPNFIIG